LPAILGGPTQLCRRIYTDLRLRKCCVKRKIFLEILALLISNQILAQSLNSNKLGGGASECCTKLADHDWCNWHSNFNSEQPTRYKCPLHDESIPENRKASSLRRVDAGCGFNPSKAQEASAPVLSETRTTLQALAMQLCVSLEWSGQADAPFELWQTGCLYGTVFALRLSLVRMQHARRKNRAGDSNPARN
jgi:hypothetical protein